MISRAKKYVAVLLVFVCVCMIFSPQTAYAAEDSSQHETVKVGFFAMDGYHVMDEEGNRSGYGYDFLRLMARYWDVDYEYVGYDKSWDDMQQMLEDGEIDMVTSARKTPDREEKFDFSRPIGTNYGMLTVRSDNSTIVDGNYSTYNGMRVALLNGNTRNEEFADFADNKGFTYVPSYFDTTAEMEEALQSEKVDAIVTSSLRKTNNERIVEKFGSSDFYVIVKKGNTELLDEINYAIHFGMLNVDEVLELLNNKPERLNVILTGRYAEPKLIDAANTVTEMTLVKHAFQKGIRARKGIEF